MSAFSARDNHSDFENEGDADEHSVPFLIREPMKEIRYKAHFWIDLRDELDDKVVQSFSLGYDGKLYVLTTYKKDNVQYRSDDGMFAMSHSDIANDYIVYAVSQTNIEQYIILQQNWNYHSVELLPNYELLLICSRTGRYGINSQENARVFTFDGTLQRSFCLGDAIETIRTMSTGEIWTSYFDEAFGRSFGETDITGLHRWNKFGVEIYRYRPIFGLKGIFDCYAMNASSDNSIWIYYYTDFPLVKIIDDRIADYWYPPIKGSHSFAVHNNHVVFIGSYDDDLFHHYKLLPDHQVEHIQTFDIEQSGRHTSRGKTIVICEDNQFYRFDIPELLRKRNRA